MNIIEQIRKNSLRYSDRHVFINSSDFLHDKNNNFLTWHDMWDFSGKLAEYIKKNTKKEEPIIVFGHKSPLMYICFIACMRSHHAYCPIDVTVPNQRVVDIINQVNPELILATEPFNNFEDIVVNKNDIEKIIRTNVTVKDDCFLSEEDIAYIIFTSGSTGKPKGVQITVSCINKYIEWAKNLIDIDCYPNREVVFLNQAPYSFDLSIMDTYLNFYYGGTVVALDNETQTNMKNLLELLEKSNINVWVSTPSFSDICLTDRTFNSKLLKFVDTFLFCGEVLTKKTVNRLQTAFPNSKIINTYGPTESTVCITDVEIDKQIMNKYDVLPVGKVKSGTIVEICNEFGEKLADGEKGEIVIIGDTVGAGYFNNPEKTKIAFSIRKIDGKEVRAYKTGDSGYFIDNLLFCVGRIDLQIKLHGYRMEIEDIEQNIMKLKYISQVCVIPIERNGKISSLTAVCVPSKEVDKDNFRDKIRADLEDLIPKYMIPKKFIMKNRLPLTSNGKLDRKSIKDIVI